MAPGTPHSTWLQDLAVVTAVAFMTAVVRGKAREYFERTVPAWKNLKPEHQSRLSVEVAVVPSRVMLVYLTAPLVWHAFRPLTSWSALDTEAVLLACSILTGAYLIDLSVTRSDWGSTLHHCMGPILLAWIRHSYASFGPEDALLNRLLISFVFFGACFSGSTTTALVFLIHFRNDWFKGAGWGPAKKAYSYFVRLLPVLALSTVSSTFFSTAYLHYWFGELFTHFGRWGYLPLGWVLLECGMQWKWLLWFYSFEAGFRARWLKSHLQPSDDMAGFSFGAWWLPAWRFVAIKLLASAWLLLTLAMAWRAGDPQRLALLLGTFILSLFGRVTMALASFSADWHAAGQAKAQ